VRGAGGARLDLADGRALVDGHAESLDRLRETLDELRRLHARGVPVPGREQCIGDMHTLGERGAIELDRVLGSDAPLAVVSERPA